MLRLFAVFGLVVGWSLIGSHLTAADKPVVAAKETKIGTATIDQALDALTEVEYLDTPLGDVVEDLKLRHGIPIQLDVGALSADGKGSDLPITKSLKNLPLASVLNLVLGSHGLDWTVHDEVLLITTRSGVANYQETKVYSIAELAVRPGFEYHFLIDVIERMISPSEWSDAGGLGGQIKEMPAHRMLIVATTYRRHREVRALLELLKRGGEEKAQTANDVGIPMHARDEIDLALQSKTEMQYLDTRLADVVTHLELRHRIPIELDARSLADGGVGADLPMTQAVKDVSLAAGLNLLLRPHNLDWTVADGVLRITTKDAAKSGNYGNVRSYSVGDLIDVDEDWNEAADEFIDVVTNILASDDWMFNGGTVGDVVSFAATKSLVVRHNDSGHREIAALLKQLREVKATSAKTGGKVERPLTTRFYPIVDLVAAYRAASVLGSKTTSNTEHKADGEKKHGETSGHRTGTVQALPPFDVRRFSEEANIFVTTLMKEVRPNTWDVQRTPTGPSIIVDPLTRSLVIRQTAAGHAAVQRFLYKVRGELRYQAAWLADPAMLPLNTLFVPQTGGGGMY
jgi:hypothetical protein